MPLKGILGKDGIFSKILVAVDGSDQSMAAAEKAIQMARRDKADIIALHVLQLPTVGHYTPSLFNGVIENGGIEAEKWFGRIKGKAGSNGVQVRTQLVESVGSPVSVIVDRAQKEQVDLIVMGTRGRTKLKKMLLGSVASGVTTYAPCTVMVVR